MQQVIEGSSKSMSEPPPEEAEGASAAPQPGSPSRSVPKVTKNQQPNPNPNHASMMPFLMITIAVVVGFWQWAEGRVRELEVAEGAWDPRPPQMETNEVVILYCSGWAYEGTYRQVHNLIMERAQDNDVVVKGHHYPVKPSVQFIVSCINFLQIFLFLGIFFGEKLREACNFAPNSFTKSITENKMVTFMVVWLIGNMLVSGISNSGAFEVFYQDKHVYSALENHRKLPNLNDISTGSQRAGLKLDLRGLTGS